MASTFTLGPAQWLDPASVRIVVRVPADCVFFEGHFEGRPMLPGVAQVVALADGQARAHFGPLGPARRLMRVKFQSVVGPGDDVVLGLTCERGPETKVRFTITRGPDAASSGVLVYG